METWHFSKGKRLIRPGKGKNSKYEKKSNETFLETVLYLNHQILNYFDLLEMLIPALTFNNSIPIVVLLYRANYSSCSISIQVFF